MRFFILLSMGAALQLTRMWGTTRQDPTLAIEEEEAFEEVSLVEKRVAPLTKTEPISPERFKSLHAEARKGYFNPTRTTRIDPSSAIDQEEAYESVSLFEKKVKPLTQK